jgi:DNA-binding MarR family transcriptional regulator
MPEDHFSDGDYRRLLRFRTEVRRFLHWSEEQAEGMGITPAQHQLLLAIRGADDPDGPSVGDLAEVLMLRHHSVVGLVDRAAEAGLVRRVEDRQDHRVVRLRLTAKGRNKLAQLSHRHAEELERLTAGLLLGAWSGQDPDAADQPQTPPT